MSARLVWSSFSDDGVVTSFAEKTELPFWINGGIYVFEREIEDQLPDVGDHETTTFPQLVNEERMRAIKSNANWISVDSHKDLREAQEMMSQDCYCNQTWIETAIKQRSNWNGVAGFFDVAGNLDRGDVDIVVRSVYH